LGDSFTEGLWDPYPKTGPFAHTTTGADGLPHSVQRGWADRLADGLAAHRRDAKQPQLRYANLAIRGRLLPQIIGQQLPAALDMKPDLISIVGGGNDILRPGVNLDDITRQLEHAIITARESGADVLMGTGFRAGRGLSWTRKATGQFNANVWSIARRHGCYVLDLWGLRSLGSFTVWADDRLHLLPGGHARVASAALVTLGLPHVVPNGPARPVNPVDLDASATPSVSRVSDSGSSGWGEDYDAPLPLGLPATARDRLTADARWFGQFALPWINRRLHRTSSGAGRNPTWPTLTPWPPPFGG
jgi:lysophospholipase L1-like esterase